MLCVIGHAGHASKSLGFPAYQYLQPMFGLVLELASQGQSSHRESGQLTLHTSKTSTSRQCSTAEQLPAALGLGPQQVTAAAGPRHLVDHDAALREP